MYGKCIMSWNQEKMSKLAKIQILELSAKPGLHSANRHHVCEGRISDLMHHAIECRSTLYVELALSFSIFRHAFLDEFMRFPQ
jgi:hypothetical protein